MTMAGVRTVPEDEEFTAAWFSEVMADACGGVPVVEARVEAMTTADIGWFGRLFRAHLDYERPGAGPASVVIKRDPEDDFVREIGFGLGYFAREVGFYRDLVSHVPVRVPDCHFAALDEGTRKYVIVLEDLAAGRFGDQERGAAPDEARALAVELAALHAWGTTVQPPPWVPPISELAAPFLDYDETFASFEDCIRGMVPDRALDVGAGMGDRMEQVYEALDALSTTIVHNDFRLDNVVFDLAPRPVIYDWQSPCRAPGAMDLASLIVTSLEADDRREVEHSIVEAYLSEAMARGLVIDRDEFQRAYDLAVVHLFLMYVLALGTNTERPMFVTTARRTSHAFAEVDVDQLL